MEIKKPDWEKEIELYSRTTLMASELALEALDAWFEREVEPINKMLAEGVEVSGLKESGRYFCKPHPMNNERIHTHKALLINIQSIVKETAEDVLRDWVDCEAKVAVRCGPLSEGGELSKLLHRAKAVLNKGREG